MHLLILCKHILHISRTEVLAVNYVPTDSGLSLQNYLISNLFYFGQRTQDFNNFNYIETQLMTQNSLGLFSFLRYTFKEMSFLCLWGLYFLKWDVNKNSYLWSCMYNVSFSPGSGCFYHYLFIGGFHWFDYMSWCGFLCVYFAWACWVPWICEFIVHNKFWKILTIIS